MFGSLFQSMPHEDPTNNPTFSSQPQMKKLAVEQQRENCWHILFAKWLETNTWTWFVCHASFVILPVWGNLHSPDLIIRTSNSWGPSKWSHVETSLWIICKNIFSDYLWYKQLFIIDCVIVWYYEHNFIRVDLSSAYYWHAL